MTGTRGAIHYDPFSPPDRDDPYPTFKRAREDEPVFFSDSVGAWIVTRYDDVLAILHDPARFSNRDTVRPTALPREVEAVLRDGYTYDDMRPLVASDQPHHTRVRKFLNAAFTPGIVSALPPRIQQLAEDLVAAIEPDGCADIIDRFCYPFPLGVILDLLALPQSDRERVHAYGVSKVALQWGGNIPLEEQLGHARGFVEFQRYFADIVEERRRAPGTDLISQLVTLAFEDEQPLGVGELVGQLMGLVTAGHETTTNLIAHALIQLLPGPDWRRLCADPAIAARVVEETLRHDSSVVGMMRVATQDVTIGGTSIAAGSKVQLMFASAGRDGRIFGDGDRFDIDRPNAAAHLAFGKGIHFCLGAPLARVEVRIALETLARRLPELRLAQGRIEFRPNAAFRGPVALRVCWN